METTEKPTDDPAVQEPTDADSVDATSTETESTEPTSEEAKEAGSADPNESSPDFPELEKGGGNPKKLADLNRFHDVQVTVTAELGRAEMTIRDLLDLAEGSVFELDRTVSAPVELYAQGVPLGNGEVVVVNDTFAIRIREIYPSQN